MNDLVIENFFVDEYRRLLDKNDGSVTCCIYKNNRSYNDYLVRYNRISKKFHHDFIVYSFEDKIIRDVTDLAFGNLGFFDGYSCVEVLTNDEILKDVPLDFFDYKL